VPWAVVIGQWELDAFPDDAQLWRDNRLEPRAMDNNKARFRQRMILPGESSTDSLLLMFPLLKKQDYDITGLLLSRK
jgi:hypothetical protein